MPCFHPLTAFQPHSGGPLIFANPEWGTTARGGGYNQLQIPCGQCSGCRLKRSREWAIRCLHEKQMHRYNSYITLTYNQKYLPSDQSLHHSHFQLFLKRLRKALGKGGRNWPHLLTTYSDALRRYGTASHTLGKIVLTTHAPVKYYMCGEYGPEHGRPHYHALLFGVDFNDKTPLRITDAGCNIYRSKTLERLWKYGFSSVGEVTFQSAAYIARYVMKKRTGDGETKHYAILDLETGEINKKLKEYNQMSRRPGIGSSWLNKFASDVYTTGKVIVRGHPNNPPRYYDKLYKKLDAAAIEHIQYTRYLEALAQTEHHTPERLAVQEQVQAARTRNLKRGKI